MRERKLVRFDLTLNRVHCADNDDEWRASRNGSEWLRDAMLRHIEGDDADTDDNAPTTAVRPEYVGQGSEISKVAVQ